MARHFSIWDCIRRLLKFENLKINTLAFIRHDEKWVQWTRWTTCLVTRKTKEIDEWILPLSTSLIPNFDQWVNSLHLLLFSQTNHASKTQNMHFYKICCISVMWKNSLIKWVFESRYSSANVETRLLKQNIFQYHLISKSGNSFSNIWGKTKLKLWFWRWLKGDVKTVAGVNTSINQSECTLIKLFWYQSTQVFIVTGQAEN